MYENIQAFHAHMEHDPCEHQVTSPLRSGDIEKNASKCTPMLFAIMAFLGRLVLVTSSQQYMRNLIGVGGPTSGAFNGTMRFLPEYCGVSRHLCSRSSQGDFAGIIQYHQQPCEHALGRVHGSSPR